MKNKTSLIVILAILLMGGSFFGGYLLYQKLNPSKPVVKPPVIEGPGLVSDQVSWLAKPEKIKNLDIFLKEPSAFPEDSYNLKDYADTYKVGEFIAGPYNKGNLLLVFLDTQTPEGILLYRVVRKEDEIILLKKHSDNYEDYLDTSKISIDNNYSIDSLLPPDTLSGPKAGQILKKEDFQPNEFFQENEKTKIFFIDEKWGKVYSYGDGGFAIRNPDHTICVYVLKIDFLGADNIPKITFIKDKYKKKNTQEYTSAEVGNCGIINYTYVVSSKENINENDLIKIGEVTDTKEPILGFENKNHPYLKKMYDESYSVVEGSKVSYDEFIADNPIFFWRDPFDRLIRFYLLKYGPAAECGKPVIYLYPKEKIKVSVKLDLKGGLRYSEPPYGNSWLVEAYPNGNIKDLKTGKIYPYLFWEGKGSGIYKRPQKGFVVERKNIHKFLVEKLTKFGLNQKEINDFIEFWEPRMKDSSYYFITFITTKEMNRLAPLEIKPAPDTIFRILMDFSPLEKPIKVQEYKIQPFKREGFTVVEWGGILK